LGHQLTDKLRPLALALLVLGTLHWALFIGMPPHLPRSGVDWPKELRYYAILKQAVSELRIPYFTSVAVLLSPPDATAKAGQETRKFLAIPETVVSPQIVLLRWLTPDAFFEAHILILQAVALAGCLALGRRYDLSPPSLVLLWLILGFNGHITSHLAAGHSMWGGYFLFPWFFLFVLRLVEEPGAAGTPIGIGVVLATILLQGSYHPFVWCVLFLLLLLVSGRGVRRGAIESLAWTAALSLWRLVPAAVVLLHHRPQEFETGYPTLTDLAFALASVHDALFLPRGPGSLGGLSWWEFDAYVGVAGLLWLVAFGGAFVSRERGPARLLVFPLVVLAILSIDGFYRPLSLSHLPLLSTERVSSRMLILPLGLLAVMAAAASDRWQRQAPRRRAWLLCGVVAVTAVSLAVHSYVWSLPHVSHLLWAPSHLRYPTIAIADSTAVGAADSLYTLSVKLSALLSAMAVGLAIGRWRRLQRGTRLPVARCP
jgi:hypothetical protein